MTTLHGLNLGLLDLHEQISRELQFSSDAKKQIRDAFTLLHDAVENVEKAVNNAMDERTRALSAFIGTGKPAPETVTISAPEALAGDDSARKAA